MRYAFAPVALSLGANALVVRQASQCVRLQAAGGASGVLGQLDDGQNRIGGGHPTGCYCLNGDGGFTDSNGRGCILTPPTTQFQCDVGANPTTGFGIGSEGGVTYNGSGKFYACPVNDNGEYNVYTEPAPGQAKCVEISLGGAGSCGAGNAPQPSGPAQPPAETQPAQPPAETQPAQPPAETQPAQPPAGTQPVYPAQPPAGTQPAQPPAGTQPPAPPANEVPPPACPQVPENPDAPGNNKPGQNGPGHNGPGGNKPGQNGPGHNGPGGNKPGQNGDKPGQNGDKPGQNGDKPGQNGPGDNGDNPGEDGNNSGDNGGNCPADLNGNYEYPHLIVPVDSKNPDKAHGTSYNGKVDGHTCSIYNFDIPASMAGKKCTLNFLFPEQKDLETSSYTTSGSGKCDITKLKSPATEKTTYANKPAADSKVGSIEMSPGHSYNIYSGDCAAGQTVTYEMCSHGGDFSMEYFQDWNPSPIGMYIRQC